MASYANISADQGADFQTSLELEDGNGDRVDLTDYSIYGQIRRTYKSSVAEDFQITIADALNGVIRIELNSTQTSGMKSGRYVYDVYAVDSSLSKTVKLLEGIFELIPSVTKDIGS
mgnify:CR=1 FL=1